MSKLPAEIPQATFHKRVVLTTGEKKWVTLTTDDLFKDKTVVIFGLPGAFTPTCSGQQLPGFENMYKPFRQQGIDDIYCFSVNDTFVMDEWRMNQGIVNVKLIPDGSGEFTIKMNMDVRKDNLGFGMRSWRYAAVVTDGTIIKSFVEEGFQDNAEGDPYEVSTPENVFRVVKEAASVGTNIELNFSDTTSVKEKFG
jgi:peroxiredoxin